MPIGWLNALKKVPWAEVASNAPKVAAGARKLWNAVGKTPVGAPNAATESMQTDTAEANEVSALQSRLTLLELASLELQAQMIESSRLIKALAEQNTQLMARTEALRFHVRWLAGALAVAVLSAIALAFVLR